MKLFLLYLLLTGSLVSLGNPPKTKAGSIRKPVLLGEKTISTEHDEFGATFSPDGKTCLFSMRSPSTIINSTVVICESRLSKGKWSRPEIAGFSGHFQDFNPAFSPDGTKLFFISNRPVADEKKTDLDIWVVERYGEGWGKPKNIGSPVNSRGWELGCSVGRDGTLYFCSTGTTGNPDLYTSRLINGQYETPVKLPEAINSAANETDPFISSDGSYLLFAAAGRQEGMSEPGASISYPRGDLYISFLKNGEWTPAKSLGEVINSTAEESNPWVSADGKTLYYTSERNFVTIPMNEKLTGSSLEKRLHGIFNGLGNIYQISFDDVSKYKK